MNKQYTILSKIEEIFPNAQSELINWNTPFQFLICIMLSAQTTDKQVNKVTEKLFKKYNKPEDFANLDISIIENEISSVNYFKNKAKYIKEMSNQILDEYNGEVPTEISKVVGLRGVGYKTANVFLNDLYKSNQGIAVDVHVARVSQRLGLSKETEPTKIAKDLEKIYKQEDWWKINRYFVLYGRYICKANMKKSECVFKDICSYCKDK